MTLIRAVMVASLDIRVILEKKQGIGFDPRS
jgi:hypothetical protein